ncbi:MAG: diadenylate cyclase CdaA [Candidatus Omnitrophota bacterium]|nr:diadenylate cyclase CdaA [Candidatus Omnitrophota bacterium]
MILAIWEALKPLIEIIILWFVIYKIVVFFEGTRAFQVLKGIILLIIAFFVFQVFGLTTLNWLMTRFFAISIIGILIIFQPEFRQGLAKLGQQHLFAPVLAEEDIVAVIKEIASAVSELSKKKIGAIMALEGESKLSTYTESGVALDSKVKSEILQSIFMPNSPLHDGGVVIRGEKIISAVCLFPLSENPKFEKITGSRHRAAVGLSEQTDAVVVMVSEQTGDIALAYEGKFIKIETEDVLITALKDFLIYKKRK